MEKYSEQYITEHADSFDWENSAFLMNDLSKEFIDQFNDEIGTRIWKNKKGEYHRKIGPAIEHNNGSKCWYINGILHRVDGPAKIYANGDREWYLHGKLHRIDRPAIEYANGNNSWFTNGVSNNDKFQ